MDGWIDRQTDRQTEIYYERFAHAIMEAEKSHNMLSVSQGTKKANGVVLVQMQRPGAQMPEGRRR